VKNKVYRKWPKKWYCAVNKWTSIRDVKLKMEELGIDSAFITDVGKLSMRTDAYCSVLKKDKIELQNWLKDNGHGDLITDTINASTLKAFMKEQIIEGNAVPDTIVSFDPYTYVAITKS